jgi:glutathione peroxidase
MKTIPTLMMVMVFLATGCMAQQKETTVNSLYDIEVNTIEGEPVKMEQYNGKVLLIVNTASKCGFTGQYDGLQKLYETYKDQGFVVLGFPANDFMRQEPGSNEEIQSFCKLNYGVTFPLFEKIAVKGKEQHPLYAYLTSKTTNPEFSGKISWNFNKFLISRDGKIVNRFGSRAAPDDSVMTAAVEAEIAK